MGSELKSILIIAAVACIFIVSTSLYIGSMYQGYDNVDDIGYLDASLTMADKVAAMQNRIEPTGTGLTDAVSYMLLSSFNAIRLVFDITPVFKTIGSGVTSELGIPTAIISLVLLIISIILIIEIIYILTGRSGS